MSNIKRIDRTIKKLDPSFVAYEKNMCVYLEGKSSDYDLIVKAGKEAVTLDHLGVVNNIVYTKEIEENKKEIDDYSLHGLSVDVLIIGGGVIGCAILRELSKYKLHSLLIEKESDIGLMSSGKNPGIVHSGVDIDKRTKKYSYYSRGLKYLQKDLDDLEVPYKKIEEKIYFKYYYERIIYPFMYNSAYNKKLTNIRFYVNHKRNELNPYKASVRFSNAFVTDSFKYVSQLGENAISNGGVISLNTYCFDMDIENNIIKCVHTNKGKIYPKIVINASGINSDKIAELANDRTFTILKEKRNVIVYDNPFKDKSVGIISKSPFMNFDDKSGEIYYKPVKGISKTLKNDHEFLIKNENLSLNVYNEIVFESKVKLSTNGVNKFDYNDIKYLSRIVYNIQNKLVKERIKRYYSFVHSNTYENDVVVRKGIITKNIIEACGFDESSIVLAHPVSEDVAQWTIEQLKNLGLEIKNNKLYSSHQKSIKRLKNYPITLRDKLIKNNPSYGEILIKDEEISLGEILDVCNSKINISTIDQIKRRLSLDTDSNLLDDEPIIFDILAKNKRIEINKIRKNTIDSIILNDEIKGEKEIDY